MIDWNRHFEQQFSAVERGPEDMHEYQRTAEQFLWDNPFSILLIDMGLGKTISSASFISKYLIQRWHLKEKILIIAPLKVATDVWPTELRLWQHTAWLNFTLLRANDDDPRLAAARFNARAKARNEGMSATGAATEAAKAQTVEKHCILAELARSGPEIHIINREAVDWLVELYGPNWPYRTVFVDESSSFKDHKTERFKALAKVRRTEGLIHRMHLMTATPAAEGYEGLFAQIYLLDLGQRLGKNITGYRKQYFNHNPYTRSYKLNPGMDKVILEKIADVSLVMKREDYLPRSEPTIIQQKVMLTDREHTMIKDLEKNFIMTLPDGTKLEAKTAAMLSSMLLQIASGCVYETQFIEDWDTDDLKRVRKVHQIHDHKLEALREIVEEAANAGENILVAYYFKSSLAKLAKAFPKATVMDREAKCVKAWNKGKIPILFLHPKNAGHGLNLQHGGSTLIVYDMIWALEEWIQLIGRIDRQGQTKPVVVKILVADKTRDETVYSALVKKQDTQEALFRILKRLIREYRKRKAELDSGEL